MHRRPLRSVLFLAVFLSLPALAAAQSSATPTSKFQWTQVGQLPAVANGMAYNIYVDNAPAAPLVGVSCVEVVSPVPRDSLCAAPIPALTPGTHTAAITQVQGTAESPKSNALSFTFVVVVTPTGFQIVPANP